VASNTIRRGSCPRCKAKARHHVRGLPDIGALGDEDGNLPDWIDLEGCLIEPGPSFDRSCDSCGLRWCSWSRPRALFSTWRDVLDHLGVETNEQANEWLGHHVWPTTSVSPFPEIDDPSAKIELQNGIAHKTLRFPFMHAEWDSTLLDLFDEARERTGAVPDFPWGTSV
jgi:hypothetical protein